MDDDEEQSSGDEITVYPRYCVPRRCRLCRFTIFAGETIVAVINGSRESSPFVYEEMFYRDTKLQAIFVSCRSTCYHGYKLEGPAVGYHAECLNFAGSRLPSAEFLRATNYIFEPLPREDRRRHQRTKQLLAERLRPECPKLPAELRLMVAQHLVRLCVVSTTEALWAARQSYHFCSLDMSKSVWARYVYIDGTRYLAALSNEPGPGYCRVHDVDSALPGGTLYISEDHLGVRQIVFDATGGPLGVPSSGKANEGHWWRTLAPCPPTIPGMTDGLKLRAIGPRAPGLNKLNVTWSLPLQPSESDSLWFRNLAPLNRTLPPLPHFQMLPFSINDPQATGYSVCWTYFFLDLHTHYNGEDMGFYQDIKPSDAPIWIYMPNDPGELMTEIWFRPGWETTESTLLFKTNRDRVTIVGTLVREPVVLPGVVESTVREWLKLYGPLEGQTKIYFNHSPWGIQHLASEQHAVLPSSVPEVPFRPWWWSPQFCFYSSACLSNVVEIIPCRWKQPKLSDDEDTSSSPDKRWIERWLVWCPPPIIGLLLRYSNGSRASVGQFRLDGAEEPLSVGDSPGLYLKLYGLSSVTKVQLFPPIELDESHTWLGMDWTGEIEWLFDQSSSWVFHRDGTSVYAG